uniref:Uncharacterized protein n=1 Tax=Pipistrellus kuhlii TaxID=59472 RepID=A0A7J7WDD4_PIPKU|nr:hypothetical protein mPipKuh1_008106 [Pipistrellus kuhlii]
MDLQTLLLTNGQNLFMQTAQIKQNKIYEKNPRPENLSLLPEGCTKPKGSALTWPQARAASSVLRSGPGGAGRAGRAKPKHRCELGGRRQCRRSTVSATPPAAAVTAEAALWAVCSLKATGGKLQASHLRKAGRGADRPPQAARPPGGSRAAAAAGAEREVVTLWTVSGT